MADRKFEYEQIGGIYEQMKKITGSESDPDSIAGILHEIDKEYREKVDVSDEAIFGDLGKQLVLDWDNVSSDFPNFVSNFENWSKLVALSARDYKQLEDEIAGFREANPLGVNSGGAKQAFVKDSYYSNAHTKEELAELASQAKLYDLTGANYLDTGMVQYAARNKFSRVVTDVLNAVGAVAVVGSSIKLVNSQLQFFKGSKALGFTYKVGSVGKGTPAFNYLHKTLGYTGHAADILPKLTKTQRIIYETKRAGLTMQRILMKSAAGSNVVHNEFVKSLGVVSNRSLKLMGVAATGSKVVDLTFGSVYDTDKYGNFYDQGYNTGALGSPYIYGNDAYVIFGKTPNGKLMMTDDEGYIYYIGDDGKIANATVKVNNTSKVGNAKMDAIMDSNTFVMNIGGEEINQDYNLVGNYSSGHPEYFDNLLNLELSVPEGGEA